MTSRDVAALVDALADAVGAPPVWRAAMHQVPRHLFVPDVVLADSDNGPDRLVDRAIDPDDWLATAYSDVALVTQLDRGAADLSAGLAASSGDCTSSCSQPSMVFAFLQLLDPYDHHRVLEIGTGTGWTAGLLSARLGDGAVVSIEVDEQLAKTAAANLDDAGWHPELVVGDGAAGRPDRAPFDRVHVTCAVRDIPYAWVEQTRPGGIIALPWSPGVEGWQVRLHVQRDGTARGPITGTANYMMLRAQHRAATSWDWAADHEETATRLDPRSLLWESYGADLALAALLPGVQRFDRPGPGEGMHTVWVAHPDGSWATARYVPGAREYVVRQHGGRRLWEEAEDAYWRWQSWGRPAYDRYGLTVGPDGQRVWLDSPDDVL